MDSPNELRAADRGAADEAVGRDGLAWWQRPTIVAACLVTVYALLSFLFDPSGYLSTDTGGKTASLAAMEARGDWDPDLGYWFEAQDPEGEFFPFMSTTHTENGQWLNTTSLTMVMVARPLWSAGERTPLGGARAILMLPILGAVGAAFGAGALERRLRVLAGTTPGSGHLAMWTIGLASPVAVYALDFWEHSLGLGAMLWGIVAALDACLLVERSRSATLRAVAAGMAFGFGATMRQEAMVYGAVAGVIVGVLALRRSGLSAAVGRGLAMLAGFAVPIAAHVAAEILLTGAPIRAARAAGTAGGAGVGLGERLHAAIITLTFPFNGEHPLSYVLGFGLVASLIWWTTRQLDGGTDRLSTSTLRAVALCIAAVWVLFSVRFVPGLVPTTPLAVLGGVAALRFRQWPVLAFGLAPVPLVLAVQFTEGAYVQWGGRYLLTTGAVLAVAAVALLGDRHRRPVLIVGVAGLLVTAYGVAWRVQRSNIVVEDWSTLADAGESVPSEDAVVVWLDGHHAREGGPRMPAGRWVTAHELDSLPRLVATLSDLGEESFLFVLPAGVEQPSFEGFEAQPSAGELVLFDSSIIPFLRTR